VCSTKQPSRKIERRSTAMTMAIEVKMSEIMCV